MKTLKNILAIFLFVFAGFASGQSPSSGAIEIDTHVDVTLGKGYTYSRIFVLNEDKFLFSHNSKTGQTDIWNLERGGLPKYSHKWSTGWTNMDFFEYKGEVYFFHQKGDEGTVRMNRLNYYQIMNNEGIGTRVYEDKWSEGWTTTKFFVHNNIIYFLHYKKSSGLARLNASIRGGSMGKRIYEKTWAKGYTNFAMTANDDNFYILYQQGGGEGTCHINHINLSKIETAAKAGLVTPNLGKVTYNKNWSSGWSNICFFNLNKKVYMFANKKKGGTARVKVLNSDGTLGKTVYDKTWSDGWSEVDVFYQYGKPQLFIQKASTGQVKIAELKIK